MQFKTKLSRFRKTVKVAELEKHPIIQISETKIVKIGYSRNTRIYVNISNNFENFIKVIRILSIPVRDKSKNLNLFLPTFKGRFTWQDAPHETKSGMLINIFLEKRNNYMYNFNSFLAVKFYAQSY